MASVDVLAGKGYCWSVELKVKEARSAPMRFCERLGSELYMLPDAYANQLHIRDGAALETGRKWNRRRHYPERECSVSCECEVGERLEQSDFWRFGGWKSSRNLV